MMELKIEINVPDLAAAISKLADAVAPGTLTTPGEPAPPVTVPVAAPAVPTVPVSTPAPAPITASAPAATPVPTAAPAYTLEQLARAGASLVDAGKMDALLALLAKYGVQAVTQLQPDQFGVFATELRGLGAQI